jgi:IS30 family transposase
MKEINNKQLTLSQRIKIEEMLNQRCRKFQIAKELDKSQSTISREINRHIIIKPHNVLKNDNSYNCKYFINCKICTGKCGIYQPISCKERDRNIGACNECSKLKSCNLDKHFYIAEKAQQKYEYTLKDSRQGVNLNSSELIELAHIICPLIKKGQSIYTILQNHPEINLCEKTIYNYIEIGLFKDWGVTNLTLKRKVKRKINKKKTLKKRKDSVNYEGRTYTDYLEYKIQNPNIPTTEMDTVYNFQSGPYIQTFIFENTSFMIGFLHKNKTADSMSNTLNILQDKLTEKEFNQLFQLLLTDRGSEFAKPQQFEINMETGEIRSKIFYCDPQASSQKPHVENNHNFIREILPNGQNWNNLTQNKINIMFSHINSTPRESLGDKTPYEIFTFIYGEKLANKLGIQKILKDEVTTTPRLLK